MPVLSALARAVDVVLPPRCIISGEIVDRQGVISPKVWASLTFLSDPRCHACGYPFEFETGKGALCGACLADRPPYERARAALVYDDASRDMILKFKHADHTHAVAAFVPWLKMAAADFMDDADMLVPVPLHRWRLLQRRYNQSALLAQALAAATGKACAVDALARTRATPSQGHLKARERAKNVRHAFRVTDFRAAQIAGKNIVLIDDVHTTGSTVKECTLALLNAGAARVDVLTLARVVRAQRID